MAHFRSGHFFIAGVVLAALASACGSSASTSTTVSQPSAIVGATGIAAADIGQPPGPVFAELNSLFGEPDVDSGWIAPESPLYGTCPGLAMRAAGWGSLYTFFVTDAAEVSEGSEDTAGRLYSYSYGYDFSRNEGATDPRNLGLETADGVHLGSTRSELQSLYGGALQESYNEEADTWTWSAMTGDGELRGLLSGPEETATVVLIESSPGCEIR